MLALLSLQPQQYRQKLETDLKTTKNIEDTEKNGKALCSQSALRLTCANIPLKLLQKN